MDSGWCDKPRTDIAPPFRAPITPPAAPEPSHHRLRVQLPDSTQADLQTVPGYEIICKLGQGGMGIVYQARQCSLQRLIALKMILAEVGSNAQACVRFRTEAEAVARLQHPNIVQIYEIGEHAGRPFVSLEYIDGGSLSVHVAGVAQPEREAARLMETLARAVHYMHQRGILHRDLKPNNILVTANGTPKIADFGLAKIQGVDVGVSQSEMTIGTPSYMAPEQAGGNSKNLTLAADVYSLGAILYELLTGRAPFRGATPLDTLEQVRNQEPILPRRLRRCISIDLQTICLKCLQKEPRQRYASAGDLADDLHYYLERRPIKARPLPAWRRLGKFARRHPAAIGWTLAALALLCLLPMAWSNFNVAGRVGYSRAEEEADLQGTFDLNADARYILLLTRGTVHFNQKELEQAAADFRRAIALAPERPNAYMNLAHVYLAQDRIAEAAQEVDRAMALRLPPEVVAGYYLERARKFLQGKQYEQSLRESGAAARLYPRQPLSYEMRGRALLALGRYEEAEKAFDQYLRAGGNENSDIFRGRGMARMRLGKYREAVEDYTKAAERSPDADIYQHRGWAYFFSDAWKLALSDFSRAIELDPDMRDAYVGRGLTRVSLDDYRGGIADAAEGLDRKPLTPEMMHNIACIFAQAIPRVQGDSQEPNRRLLAGRYRIRALVAIRETLTMLPPEERLSFWQDKILPDTALDPIRNEAEFKNLQEQYARHR
jgi:tetratricopeptide (TPR) repeat protein